MKKKTILVNGVEYPFDLTMGALLRYKREAGLEAISIDPNDLEQAMTFIWCCVVSACRRDGVPFGLALDEFADSLTPQEVVAAARTLNSAAASSTGGEVPAKKKRA